MVTSLQYSYCCYLSHSSYVMLMQDELQYRTLTLMSFLVWHGLNEVSIEHVYT